MRAFWVTKMDEAKPQILLLRPAKAALMLDMSKSKLYDALHRGEIPSLRIAGQIRVPVAAVEKLISERLERGIDSDE